MRTRKNQSEPLWGMIHYDLIGDGCLNGIWTNNDMAPGVLLNEIARKIDIPRNELQGQYHCSWIEPDEEPTNGLLRIVQTEVRFDLEWTVDGQVRFRGVGMQLGVDRLVVLYWGADVARLPFL